VPSACPPGIRTSSKFASRATLGLQGWSGGSRRLSEDTGEAESRSDLDHTQVRGGQSGQWRSPSHSSMSFGGIRRVSWQGCGGVRLHVFGRRADRAEQLPQARLAARHASHPHAGTALPRPAAHRGTLAANTGARATLAHSSAHASLRYSLTG